MTPPRGRPSSTAAEGSQAAVPILVVDDNPTKLLAVEAILAPLGHRIVAVDSGLAALRCVSVQDFAVILLDVRMPIMDGFETAALIRMRLQSEITPIIFVTAHERDEVITSERYAQGAVDFISAPIQPDELRAKVTVFANLFLKAKELAAKAREVQTSVDQLRLLTDAAPIGIFQTDRENRYVYTNPRWSEITGLSPAAVAGERWDVIVDRDQTHNFGADVPDRSVDGPELSYRFELEDPDSTKRVVLLNSRSIIDTAGEVTGWVGTLSDITAVAHGQAAMLEARDEAAAASQLKSDFLATMSHEIRTPMNGVLGMTELLLQTELDADQRGYAETVRLSGDALLTVINDILDFSMIETGKVETENVAFGLVAVLEGVVDLLQGLAQNKSSELTTVLANSVPHAMTGDPGRLRQVLINLIGNAIKFSASATITIAVTVENADRGTMLRFEVSDTGIGIASHKLATIFEPFVQADMSTTRTNGGTGLGLAITHRLVSLMGGDVGVSSVPGAGSTFWFTLPVTAVDDEETLSSIVAESRPQTVPVTAAAGSHQLHSDPAAGRILLAEDNVINQKVATAMLTNAGYHVDVVPNGAEAVRMATSGRYDAILMDCRMPGLNGFEATAAIRAYEGDARHTPILALTAGARDEDREHCLAAGMDEYLSKPIRRDALLAMVGQAMGPPPHPAAVA